MMTLSYFIWIYLISYAGSILTTVILGMPYFSSVNSDMKADMIFTVISALITMFLGVITEMFTCGIYLYFLNVSTGREAQTADTAPVSRYGSPTFHKTSGKGLR